ncbi:MAG: hypothetical protein JWQ01_4579 [Massilia sp.]|nr:hypothetical protein [Massilia sp.]
MIILGVIGSLIALVGSIITMIGGVGGTAVGMLGQNNATATSGAFVFWSGAIAILISVLALIFSVIGGSAKKRNVILIFSLATLVTGLLNIYLYNWFSGCIIVVGGLLGLIGAKDGLDHDQPIKKSPLLYTVSIALVILVGASAVIKNGKAITESDSTAAVAPTTALPSAPAPAVAAIPSIPAQPSEKLPFSGRQSFNFDGGSGTEKAITPLGNGRVRVETLGPSGSSVDYEGPFTNPLLFKNESGLLFKDNKVFLTDRKTIAQDCKDPGQDCVSELYPTEAPQASEQLNLRAALADKNAITCRYNESENMCGDLDGQGKSYAAPQKFAAQKGYPTIIKQQSFDEPGTTATYLKMTVRN